MKEQSIQLSTRKFLSKKLIAKLATVASDGWPHVTPVWFFFDGSNFLVNTSKERIKFKNILRDPRVQLLIEDGYRYVLVKGYATVAENRDPYEDIKMLSVRYLGKKKGLKQYRDFYSKGNRVSIIIKPVKIISSL